MKNKIGMFGLFIILTGCDQPFENSIPIIGQTEDGKVIQKYVPVDKYEAYLSQVVQTVDDSVQVATQNNTNLMGNIKVETLSVGLGISAEFKIKFITTLGAGARMRLHFSENPNVHVP